MQCSSSLGDSEQGAMRRAERWKKKALVCEDFQKAAARTQTTLFSPLDYLHHLKKKKKKKKKMVDSLNKLSFVQCRLVVFPPLAAEAPGIEKLSSPFTRRGNNIPERTQVERKKKVLFAFSIRKRLKEMTKAFCLSCFLLCGKCCSSLLTLPGAHPVCEIFNMRTVPLCSDETMMIHSF